MGGVVYPSASAIRIATAYLGKEYPSEYDELILESVLKDRLRTQNPELRSILLQANQRNILALRTASTTGLLNLIAGDSPAVQAISTADKNLLPCLYNLTQIKQKIDAASEADFSKDEYFKYPLMRRALLLRKFLKDSRFTNQNLSAVQKLGYRGIAEYKKDINAEEADNLFIKNSVIRSIADSCADLSEKQKAKLFQRTNILTEVRNNDASDFHEASTLLRSVMSSYADQKINEDVLDDYYLDFFIEKAIENGVDAHQRQLNADVLIAYIKRFGVEPAHVNSPEADARARVFGCEDAEDLYNRLIHNGKELLPSTWYIARSYSLSAAKIENDLDTQPRVDPALVKNPDLENSLISLAEMAYGEVVTLYTSIRALFYDDFDKKIVSKGILSLAEEGKLPRHAVLRTFLADLVRTAMLTEGLSLLQELDLGPDDFLRKLEFKGLQFFSSDDTRKLLLLAKERSLMDLDQDTEKLIVESTDNVEQFFADIKSDWEMVEGIDYFSNTCFNLVDDIDQKIDDYLNSIPASETSQRIQSAGCDYRHDAIKAFVKRFGFIPDKLNNPCDRNHILFFGLNKVDDFYDVFCSGTKIMSPRLLRLISKINGKDYPEAYEREIMDKFEVSLFPPEPIEPIMALAADTSIPKENLFLNPEILRAYLIEAYNNRKALIEEHAVGDELNKDFRVHKMLYVFMLMRAFTCKLIDMGAGNFSSTDRSNHYDNAARALGFASKHEFSSAKTGLDDEKITKDNFNAAMAILKQHSKEHHALPDRLLSAYDEVKGELYRKSKSKQELIELLDKEFKICLELVNNEARQIIAGDLPSNLTVEMIRDAKAELSEILKRNAVTEKPELTQNRMKVLEAYLRRFGKMPPSNAKKLRPGVFDPENHAARVFGCRDAKDFYIRLTGEMPELGLRRQTVLIAEEYLKQLVA